MTYPMLSYFNEH